MPKKLHLGERAERWLRAAGVRALKTFAQTCIATAGTAMVLSDVDWVSVLSASLLAAALSVMTSVAGLPEVPEEGAEEGAAGSAGKGGSDGKEG